MEEKKLKYMGLVCEKDYNLILQVQKEEFIEQRDTEVNLINIIQTVLKEMLDELDIKYEEMEIIDISNKMLKLYNKNSDMPYKISFMGLILIWINSELEFNLLENISLYRYGENYLQGSDALYLTMQLDFEKIIKFAILNQRRRLLSIYATLSGKIIEVDLPDLKYVYSPNTLIKDEDDDLVITDDFLNIETIIK